ncbi:MAG: hypothetical protein M0R31_07490 [Candidatus Riflebacteria bacterium]|nr:hypothetical protein [Candidatus Riflebacteria bacterium]
MDIDEDSLDVEWLEQPKKMVQMVKIAAKVKINMERAKDNLAQVKAELAKKVRAAPEKYGIEKITIDAVNDVVQTNAKYIEAYEEYLEAVYENDVASGSVKATEQRKSSLENLVKLHGQQYFAGPKVPRNLSEQATLFREKVQRSKEVKSKIGKRLKRTKK